MRALALTLLLALVLFLAWAAWVDAPAPAPAPAVPLPALQVLAAEAPVAVAPGKPAAASRCASLGPLADEDAAHAVSAALVTQGLTGRERQAVVEEPDGWWVHVDHLGEEAARARVLHQLQVAGIHGAIALPDTSQVSVGLFAEQASAEQRAAAVRKAGPKAEVGPRTRLATRYWLDVDAPASVPLPSVEAISSGLHPAAPLSWQACPAAPAGGPTT